MDLTAITAGMAEHWHIWLISAVLIVAAVIDGIALKVPNWLTFAMILSGWAYSGITGSWLGLGYSLLGTFVGLMLLFVLHLVGGMGGGDVKLLAGIGAWLHTVHVLNIFTATAILGGVMAVLMIARGGRWAHHWRQARQIVIEWFTVRDADKLYEIAAERKPTMMLLPYGIPMTIAALGYFAYCGMYF